MLDLLYTSTKQITNYTSLYYFGTSYFLKEWDAIMYCTGYDMYKTFRDGTTIKMGSIGSNVTYVPREDGSVLYYSLFSQKAFKACKFSLQPVLYPPLIEGVLSQNPCFIDIERDYYFVKISNGRQVDVYQLSTNTFIKRITVGYATGTYNYSYAGIGRFCAIAENGNVTIYDYISWQPVMQSELGITIKQGVYDSNYNIILAIDTTGHINVFSLEDSGKTLSAPTFSPVGNKYKCSGYKLTTRLLGGANTPIQGKWINWELVGNKGTLEKAFSITDKNGYAYNFYYGPGPDGATGSETVRVWCEI